MSAVGPQTPEYKAGIPDPTNSFEFTPGAGDTSVSTIFTCGYAQKLTMNTAGTIYIQRAGDVGNSVWVKYVLTAGQSITGNIASVGGTTRGTTASMDVVLEV